MNVTTEMLTGWLVVSLTWIIWVIYKRRSQNMLESSETFTINSQRILLHQNIQYLQL